MFKNLFNRIRNSSKHSKVDLTNQIPEDWIVKENDLTFESEIIPTDWIVTSDDRFESKQKAEDLILTDEEINEFVIKEINKRTSKNNDVEVDFSKQDPLFIESARLICACQQGSTSLIQRKFSIGYNRAGRILDQLEIAGVVGPFSGSKSREVLVSTDYELDCVLYGISTKERHFKNHILPHKIDYIESKINEYNTLLLKEELKQELLIIAEEKKNKIRVQQLKDQVRQELIEEGLLLDDIDFLNREPIPQDVQDKVWNRDGGRCVKCSSNEKLEFDHIIPFSKGGSNSYRNLQLLCEKCNRQKSNRIG